MTQLPPRPRLAGPACPAPDRATLPHGAPARPARSCPPLTTGLPLLAACALLAALAACHRESPLPADLGREEGRLAGARTVAASPPGRLGMVGLARAVLYVVTAPAGPGQIPGNPRFTPEALDGLRPDATAPDVIEALGPPASVVHWNGRATDLGDARPTDGRSLYYTTPFRHYIVELDADGRMRGTRIEPLEMRWL